ncbi:MAG TPA: dockerin type I domain-containing protein [Planctomycetota bacterium]|nr:dockerin type I domain-containing protein [Planctomycetota bacterium]
MKPANPTRQLPPRAPPGWAVVTAILLAAALILPIMPSALAQVSGGGKFVRGDSNGDDRVDISDPVYTIRYLFVGGPTPPCLAAADANDDDRLDISDPIVLLRHLFMGGGPLPLPGPLPDLDPTPGLNCEL